MQLLHLLSDGRFHSGEVLGAALGMSRTGVWKQLRRWQQKGLVFDVVRGKGYRWSRPIEWWAEEPLRQGINQEINSLITHLQIEPTVASTNEVAMELLQRRNHSGVVCLAEEQTAGRGRRGRQWAAPLGAGFYGSIGWIFEEGVAALEGLSLATGLVVAQALEGYGVTKIGLKWPNDLMLDGAKLGGILIEMHLDTEGRCLVVIGVGINIDLPNGTAHQLNREVADVAGHFPGERIDRNRLGAKIIEAVVQLLSNYGSSSFAGLRDAWCERDILKDKVVELVGAASIECHGIAKGVDQHGALVVETSLGIKHISSGEVSLRGI